MTPTDLFALLQRSGFTIRSADGRLLISPASRLTDDERAALREHRDGLLAILEAGPVLSVGSPAGPKANGPVVWVL